MSGRRTSTQSTGPTFTEMVTSKLEALRRRDRQQNVTYENKRRNILVASENINELLKHAQMMDTVLKGMREGQNVNDATGLFNEWLEAANEFCDSLQDLE